MTRKIAINGVTVSAPGSPGAFVIGDVLDDVAGNWTSVFQGRFYRDSTGVIIDHYLYAGQAGYQLVQATTFQVIDNPRYSGTYTVFTKTASLDSSSFLGGETVVRVNETVPSALAPTDLTSGYITNVSTYLVMVGGELPIVIPPTVALSAGELEVVGRNTVGWGEGHAQNLVSLAQHFASTTAPSDPLTGQLWFDLTRGTFRAWNGVEWTVPNEYRVEQPTPQQVWTITHNFNLPAPFIVQVLTFVNVGGGVFKQMFASDMLFADANTVVVTFTAPMAGWALVKL